MRHTHKQFKSSRSSFKTTQQQTLHSHIDTPSVTPLVSPGVALEGVSMCEVHMYILWRLSRYRWKRPTDSSTKQVGEMNTTQATVSVSYSTDSLHISSSSNSNF